MHFPTSIRVVRRQVNFATARIRRLAAPAGGHFYGFDVDSTLAAIAFKSMKAKHDSTLNRHGVLCELVAESETY